MFLEQILTSIPMIVAAGAFLLGSFILPKTGYPAGQLLAWFPVIVCGLPILYLALERLVRSKGISKISSNLLITTGMIASVMIGDVFAAGEIAFIMAVGELLEEMTTNRAKKGLKNLISLVPQTGRRIRDGKEEMVDIARIGRDDVLRILPGEAIPVDGVILEGESSVDQSIMTGESMPVDKMPGDEVYCGTINRFGVMDIRATRVGNDSSLQKLIRMVREAEENQAPTQRIADKWASWLVPASFLTAIVTLLVTKDIVRAVTILVVFCPCALVLATPTAIMAAIGQATKRGVIIKSGVALEEMGRVDVIAFDKTGTLTRGTPTVSDVVSFRNEAGWEAFTAASEQAAGVAETGQTAFTPDTEQTALLAIAASAESKSEHPLGKAVVAFAREHEIAFPACGDFKMSVGKGVFARVEGKGWYLGSESYLENLGLPISGRVKKALKRFRMEGKVAVILADEHEIAGVIALSDQTRPEAREMIGRLTAMNVKPVLLTGDNQRTAEYLAAQLGIGEVRANLLPEDKVSALTSLMEKGKVCMIGDGVNDAPALKCADVGVAMGAMGSDIAVDAADVALMTDDIANLPYLKWLSVTTLKTIRSAITLFMTINFAAVILSVLGILTPTTGALVHNLGSCFVVFMASLLYDKKYE